MISKKYLILNKAKEDFEKRIEQGENIQFNFTCNSCKNKRRRLNHTTGDSDEEYYMDVSSSSDYSSTEEEEEVSTTVVAQSKRVNTRVTPSVTPSTTTTTTTRRSRSSFYNQGKKSNSNVTKNSNANAQTECCIIGCDNTVTNRLRFSLRCHKEDDFKSEFLDQGWNKVCHYHYFSDLYKFKKQNKANKNGATATTTTSTKKKNTVTTQKKTTTTTQKRSREEFEAAVNTSPFEELTIIPAPAIMMETKQPLTPCKAVTPNTKIDASIFFSFVGGLANSSNITKAM